MTKPASYPFLAIAKRYGLDYGDVLTLADHWRKHPHLRPIYSAIPWDNEAINETLNANAEFLAIQRGDIDWNTGERKNWNYDPNGGPVDFGRAKPYNRFKQGDYIKDED